MTLESRPLSTAAMVGVMMGERKKHLPGRTPPWHQRIAQRLSRRADEA